MKVSRSIWSKYLQVILRYPIGPFVGVMMICIGRIRNWKGIPLTSTDCTWNRRYILSLTRIVGHLGRVS
jgi:hypothetical protein